MREKSGLFFLAALLTLCAGLFTTNIWAEESKTQSEGIWTRDKLTGDFKESFNENWAVMLDFQFRKLF
jgi:hypothetical protein